MPVLPRAAAIALSCVLALAACGGDPEQEAADAPATDAPADTEPADEPDDPADGGGEDAPTLTAGATALGDVLVSGDGFTLYVFDPDEGGEPTCYDDCAANWPPLLSDGEPSAGEGADAALLGTVERDDGGTQVTYDGWPLYQWAGDDEPGDVGGQGVGDAWWAIAADGAPLREADGDGGEAEGS